MHSTHTATGTRCMQEDKKSARDGSKKKKKRTSLHMETKKLFNRLHSDTSASDGVKKSARREGAKKTIAISE